VAYTLSLVVLSRAPNRPSAEARDRRVAAEVNKRAANTSEISNDPSNFCCMKRVVGGGPEITGVGVGVGAIDGDIGIDGVEVGDVNMPNKLDIIDEADGALVFTARLLKAIAAGAGAGAEAIKLNEDEESSSIAIGAESDLETYPSESDALDLDGAALFIFFIDDDLSSLSIIMFRGAECGTEVDVDDDENDELGERALPPSDIGEWA